MDWTYKLTFKEFCDFCEVTVKEPKKVVRQRHLERFLASCRSRPGQESLFPLLRLLLPHLDRDRGSYRIKETLLASLYVTFLQLGPTSVDALKLKNFRAPKNNPSDAGDFAAVLHTVMRDRGYEATGLSCGEVSAALDGLVARSEGREGTKEVERLLKQMFLKMAPLQQKWFVRLILKDLKIGLGPTAILTTFHPDAPALLDVQASLSGVCLKLRDPATRLHELEIELGAPFRPQLADRLPLHKIEKLFRGGEFFIETKYDGERCQVHLLPGHKMVCFSRNGHDFTSEYEAAGLGEHLRSGLASRVTSAVLDGEMCAWSREERCLVQKGEQTNIRGLQGGQGERMQQCLVLYDICLLNGQVVTGRPYRERVRLLEDVVRVTEGRLVMAERAVGTTVQDVVRALNTAVDRREEGLVLKDPGAVYRPGGRAGAGWVKVKPEYEDGLVDTLDLAVLGGYWGRGRGGGQVSHFLLGVRGEGGVFFSLSRASGLGRDQAAALAKACTEGRGRDVRVGREVPEVWYDPEHSPVVEVRASEITASGSMGAGMSLRFPRVERVREDKTPDEVCSLRELEQLRGRSSGKLFGANHLGEGEGAEQPRKKARIAERAGLGARFQAQDLATTRVHSLCLKDQVQ